MKTKTKKLGHLLPLVLALVLTGCQQGLTPIEEQQQTVIETTNGLEPCADGTLNCYVDIPENPDLADIVNDPESAYESCMDQALTELSCDVNPFSLSAAEAQCGDEDFLDAEEVCSVLLDDLGLNIESDPISIPEGSKAITVKVQSCLDKGPAFFQFKGTNMGTRKFHQGVYRAKKHNSVLLSILDPVGIFSRKKSVKLPHQVSANPGCSSGRKGKVQLTFTPYKGQSAYDLNGQFIETIAFSDSVQDEVELTWKAPHLTTAQIPRALLSELDLSQITWVKKSIDTPNNPLIFNIPTYQSGWLHVSNGHAYAESIVGFSPSWRKNIDFTMVVFVKANQ